MRYKIVADSSANLETLTSVPFSSVPLHILAGDEDFIDDSSVDLDRMEHALDTCKSSGTACPGSSDWLDAFGNAQTVFCITITSSLSGSYASAAMARREYEERYPARHVHIIDSLSTGPEMVLIIEKLQEMILSGMEEAEILREIRNYVQHTHLLFSLKSLTNLANNGRVGRTTAKLAGILGIRIIGQASAKGELELLSKCRGEQSTLSQIVRFMQEKGYAGGKIRIVHNRNEASAYLLYSLMREAFGHVDIRIGTTRALCSYYAEKGGLLIGFES